MKNIFALILLATITGANAQVIIGDAVGTATTKTSVLLEFAKNDNVAFPKQSKGIIVPYVRTLPSGSALVGGSIILDATTASTARMKYYNAVTSTWVDLSGQVADVTTFMTAQPTLTAAASAHAIIGDAASTADGVLVLESVTKAMVLPTVTDVQNVPSPSPGMMVYVSGVSTNFNKRLAVFNGARWSFWQTNVPPVANVPTVTSTTGRVWMDRNLGATQVATSATDAASYGDLYQWGRLSDGHNLRNSAGSTNLSSTDLPASSNFIISPSAPNDWRSPQNVNLWQGVNGKNNPCPSGFRLPTEAEWLAEAATWSSQNAAGAFASPLKLTLAGYRDFSAGSVQGAGTLGFYWSSTTNTTNSQFLTTTTSAVSSVAGFRAYLVSVRCIKN